MFNSPEFQGLRREYIKSALERTSHLQEEAGRLRSGQTVDLQKLRQEIHKFRGSGGFYGFADLSAASATAEDQLIMVIDGEAERDDATLAALVDRVVDAALTAGRDLGILP